MMTKKIGIAFLVAVFPFVLGQAIVAIAGDSDTVPASGGGIEITPITHGSVQIEYGGKVIYVDPWSRGDYSGAPPADLILVTDIHGDHLDPEMITKLRKSGTPVVAPAAAASKIENPTVLANGETRMVAGVAIEGVPMYNLVRGPEEGKLFHDRGRGNGYILTLGGKRIYFSGDTECVPEIRALENIDVAFITMNLPYTMPPNEAADCVKAFAPKIVYPYHYRGSDLSEFAAPFKERPEIEVRLLEWY